MDETPGGEQYRPELIPRRGEMIAWACTGMALLAGVILRIGERTIPWGLSVLAALLFVAACLISMGNFVDRHTSLTLDSNGVEFKNGLRAVRLSWTDIREVRIFPSKLGDKVQVFGADNFFQFRTLGEVHMNGEVKGRMGFAQGDKILRTLILRAGLQIVDRAGDGYYYARG